MPIFIIYAATRVERCVSAVSISMILNEECTIIEYGGEKRATRPFLNIVGRCAHDRYSIMFVSGRALSNVLIIQ